MVENGWVSGGRSGEEEGWVGGGGDGLVEENGYVSGGGLGEEEGWVGGGREKCPNYLHRWRGLQGQRRSRGSVASYGLHRWCLSPSFGLGMA